MVDERERKRGSLREEHREQTRQRMLEAAEKLFIDVGYEQTTMEMIAREARVGRATLFKYFSNKQQLMLPLAQRMMEGKLRPGLEGILRESLSTREALRAVFGLLQREILSVPALAEAFVAAFSMPASREAGEDSGFTRFLMVIVQGGQRRGEVRNDVRAEVIASSIATLHTALFVQVIREGRSQRYMESVDEMLSLLEGGWRAT